MKHPEGRKIGNELKPFVERLKKLEREERVKRGPDTEALAIAVVNVDSAIEILTE